MPIEHSVVSTMPMNSSLSASAGKLISLSYRHLSAAVRFSCAVGPLEQEHQDQPIGEFWEEIFSLSTACVLTAAASVEAYANELFFERDTVFPGYSSDLLTTYDRKPTKEKFDYALSWRKCPDGLDWGKPPGQDVTALIKLRDALMHYKLCDSKSDHNKSISNKLRYKFEPSPFFSDDDIFPQRWASYSCTKWAVKSVVDFLNEFVSIASLPDKFTRRLPEPSPR